MPDAIRRYAVLVGIDAYDNNQTQDLGGAVNDVRDTLKTLRTLRGDTQLQFEAIRVFTSPKIDAPDDEMISYHEADGASLQGAFEGLRGGGDGPTHAIVLYSGHSVLAPEQDGEGDPALTLHLVPQDASGDTGLIPCDLWLSKASEQFGAVFAGIDCCSAGGIGAAVGEHPNTLVFAAATRDVASRERWLGGELRGLFTWSLLRAVEQAMPVTSADPRQSGLDISYGQTLQICRQIMAALAGVQAHPAVAQAVGGQLVDPTAMLKRVGQMFDVAPGSTMMEPTRLGERRQWDGGLEGVALRVTGGTLTGDQYLIVGPTTNPQPGQPVGTVVGEYLKMWWTFDLEAQKQNGTALSFMVVSNDTPGLPTNPPNRVNNNLPLANLQAPSLDSAFEMKTGQGEFMGYVRAFQGGNGWFFEGAQPNERESLGASVNQVAFTLNYPAPSANPPQMGHVWEPYL